MSVPVGRMVDRFHRVSIMIGGLLAWSAATVACGLALGPTLVAACTDYLFRDPAMVAWSLSLVSVSVAPIAIAFLVPGMKPYARRAVALRAVD